LGCGWAGQTINLMTLGGLALAVGILVDEATVAVENLHVHLARGESLARPRCKATRQTALPRLLAMLCILAVFLPAFFMQGAARALFTPLALAVGFSMAASFVLSSTLVPILSVWLLKSSGHVREPGWLLALQRGYASALKPLLRARLAGGRVYLAVTVMGRSSFWDGGSGWRFFHRSRRANSPCALRASPGTRLESTEQIALKALELIHREAGGTNMSLTIGLVGVHAPNYPVNLIHLWNSGPDEAHLSVQLRAHSGVAIPALKERLRTVFAAELPGVRVSFEPSDIVSRVMSFGSPPPSRWR
jgi:multidrug efflux pump subunit AcrB